MSKDLGGWSKKSSKFTGNLNFMQTQLHQLYGNIDIYLFDQLLKGRIARGMRILDARGYSVSATWPIAFPLWSAGRAQRTSSYSSKNARLENRYGTPACGTRCIKLRKPRGATSKASGRTRSGVRISRGGSKSAAAPSKPRRSLAIAIWR